MTAGRLRQVEPLPHVDEQLVLVVCRRHVRGAKLRARDPRTQRLLEIDRRLDVPQRVAEIVPIPSSSARCSNVSACPYARESPGDGALPAGRPAPCCGHRDGEARGRLHRVTPLPPPGRRADA